MSLIGEQWSPKTAPLNTAAMTDAIIVSDPGANDKQTGMERGMSTPIVPQEVPVVKDMSTPRIKTDSGKRAGGREPLKACERNEAAPSSRKVPLRHHAAMSTREGEIKRPIPLMNSFAGDKPEAEMGCRLKRYATIQAMIELLSKTMFDCASPNACLTFENVTGQAVSLTPFRYNPRKRHPMSTVSGINTLDCPLDKSLSFPEFNLQGGVVMLRADSSNFFIDPRLRDFRMVRTTKMRVNQQ